MTRILQRYAIGKDFAESDYHKWQEQLVWWISERYPGIKNQREHADKVLKAALNGTKLDGKQWNAVPDDFFNRVKLLAGFDLQKGVGIRYNKSGPKTNGTPKTTAVPPIDLTKSTELRLQYITDLLTKYPHLDNPVYKPKVEELAETIVKSRMISTDFLAARGRDLELLSKIRESLHNQIGQLMKFLEIAPEQRVKKTLESKNSDVGSLIKRLEEYGEVWKEYEKLDALRELLQKYRMLQSKRPDGTPQLDAWELWHMTRNRPINFTCECGKTYELLGGFTPEEIEQALIQAHKVYGFGLEAIGDGESPGGLQEILDETFAADEQLDLPPEEDINV